MTRTLLPSRTAVTLLLLFAGAAVAFAAPKAVAPKMILDVGELPRGDKTTVSFAIENRGDETLIIDNYTRSCACTGVEFTEEIAPGETGSLDVDLDTTTFSGPYNARISVYTNDPDNPRLDFSIRVNSKPYIGVGPQGNYRFSAVQKFDGEARIYQVLWARDPEEFSITGVESPYPFIETSFRPASDEEKLERRPSNQWIVEAVLNPDAPVGALTGYIEVQTEHAKQTKVSVPLIGFIKPVMAVTPPKAEIGPVIFPDDPAEGFLGSVFVQNFATEAIEITKVETDVDIITVELVQKEPGREWYVSVAIPRDAPKGPIEGTITITTASPRMPKIEVPVSATIQ